MKIEEITFDLDDKNIFDVDDLKLRAEAIRHSILPKLEIIANYSVAKISELYELNPLEKSTIIKFPAFRSKRSEKEFKIDYPSAQAGLGGKRNSDLWNNVLKKSGGQPIVVPFSLTYELSKEGLSFYFSTDRYNLTLKDNSIFYSFYLDYEKDIFQISNLARVSFAKYFYKDDIYDINPFTDLANYLIWQKDFKMLELLFSSTTIDYPITNSKINELINQFIMFYPVYDNHIQLASGNKIRLKQQINSLNNWLEKSTEEDHFGGKETMQTGFDRKQLLEKAEKKIKVMPAMRWQVFQRDNWRCVSCGRSSEHGIILHIDHIIPRSKGGKDNIDNYQTLCDICNIGKSNKDDTDLRKLKRKTN